MMAAPWLEQVRVNMSWLGSGGHIFEGPKTVTEGKPEGGRMALFPTCRQGAHSRSGMERKRSTLQRVPASLRYRFVDLNGCGAGRREGESKFARYLARRWPSTARVAYTRAPDSHDALSKPIAVSFCVGTRKWVASAPPDCCDPGGAVAPRHPPLTGGVRQRPTRPAHGEHSGDRVVRTSLPSPVWKDSPSRQNGPQLIPPHAKMAPTVRPRGLVNLPVGLSNAAAFGTDRLQLVIFRGRAGAKRKMPSARQLKPTPLPPAVTALPDRCKFVSPDRATSFAILPPQRCMICSRFCSGDGDRKPLASSADR